MKLETKTRNDLLTYAAMLATHRLITLQDCYFCLTNTKGISRKNKSKIKYPNCRSTIKLVQQSSTVPILSTFPIGAFGQDASSFQSQNSNEESYESMKTLLEAIEYLMYS